MDPKLYRQLHQGIGTRDRMLGKNSLPVTQSYPGFFLPVGGYLVLIPIYTTSSTNTTPPHVPRLVFQAYCIIETAR